MKKVAIIGPESTGKSTLTIQLADYFKEPFVPEFGRLYLEKHGPAYNYEDLLHISKGMQLLEQQKAQEANEFLFCDTDLIMMKVWYEVKYGNCHPWVNEQLQLKPYDFYFLCSPDLPWEADPLRENPEIREALFYNYLQQIELTKLPYKIIEGTERLNTAIDALKKLR